MWWLGNYCSCSSEVVSEINVNTKLVDAGVTRFEDEGSTPSASTPFDCGFSNADFGGKIYRGVE